MYSSALEMERWQLNPRDKDSASTEISPPTLLSKELIEIAMNTSPATKFLTSLETIESILSPLENVKNLSSSSTQMKMEDFPTQISFKSFFHARIPT